MPLVKHYADFFIRHVLRRSHLQDTEGKPSEVIPDDDATHTLRTYPPGGDPVHDRIEFHLGKGPGGFRDPK